MRVLLDTHAILWFANDDGRLSVRAREVIQDVGTERLVSVASAWELAIKTSLGKLAIDAPFGVWFERLRMGVCAEILPIELADAERTFVLPWHHRDPFDRMLIAQAQVRNLALISADEHVASYGIDVIW